MISCCLFSMLFFFFFKQKTAYEMRISDWSSDVCSSDLLAQRGRHLVGQRAGDDHHVGLPRARPEHDAEAVEVVAAGRRLHHLHRAACEAEGHRPQRAGLRPGGQLVHLRQHEALVGHFLRDAGQGRVLLRARREGGERLLEVAYSHSSAPFFHSYTKPTVRIPRKIIIDQKPIMPMSPRATAQGNRKATSRSKMMNRMATR